LAQIPSAEVCQQAERQFLSLRRLSGFGGQAKKVRAFSNKGHIIFI